MLETTTTPSQTTEHLSIGRNLKIALFHLGSGMADVLTTGVWNRIMISDLGFAAAPIGLLVALRYFLAPLGVWAGRMSDDRVILGFRRLFWVWLGRAMMVISTFMLGYATATIAREGDNLATSSEWMMIVASLLLFSVGSSISGTTFLALVYDRAPEHQRGRAVGIVWTFLLLGFTVGGILFSVLLPSHSEESTEGVTHALSFSPDTLLNLFLVAGVLFGVIWVLSLLGEEKRSADVPLVAKNAPQNQEKVSILKDLSLVWTSAPMRFFFFYLTLSMFFAFSQDLILEPFAGDVFDMPARVTNRFAAYWGSTAILGTLIFLWLSRRYKWLTNTVMSQIGVVLLTITFALFAFSSFANLRGIVTPALVLLGVGLGIWNVGTLGLMMDLSPTQRAGTFLGFWTMAVTLARGGGVASGGILRDLGVALGGDFGVAYGATFLIGAIGLGVSAYCLWQVNVKRFKQETAPQDVATILAGAMD